MNKKLGFISARMLQILSIPFFLAQMTDLQAARISFTANSPAVADDVNANFIELYNSMWTKTVSDLSYSAGNVGIGVANPGVKLGVVGGTPISNSTTGFAIFGATGGIHISVDSSQMQSWSAGTASALSLNPLGGYVGINTTSPAPTSILEVRSTDSSGGRGILSSQFSADNINALVATRKARGTASAPVAISSGDQLGNFAYQAYDGTAFGTGAYMLAVADENWTAAAHGTTLRFITTANTTTTNAERIRIDHNGNVGIGETAPSQKLDVGGNMRVQGTATITGNTTVSSAELYVTGTSGRIGINNTNPARKLDISGSGYLARFGDASGTATIEFEALNGPWGIGKFNTTNDNFDFFYNGNWRVGLNNTNGNYSQSSDIRLKKDIKKLDHVLDKLMLLEASSFSWRESGAHDIGLIAQNVEKVFPEFVSLGTNGYKALSYAKLVAPLIEGVKELKSEKDTQILALQKRASEADARAAKLEKSLASEQLARKQQEIRLAQLELRLTQLAQRAETRVVARR